MEIQRESHPAFLMFGWNAAAAAMVSLAFVVSLTGRTVPSRVTPAWLLAVLLVFALTLGWLVSFSNRLSKGNAPANSRTLRTIATIEGPLVALSLLIILAFYISDRLAYQFVSVSYPIPAVAILTAAAATLVAQSAVLRGSSMHSVPADAVAAVAASGNWAVPGSLLLLGLLQGSSYLWVIGNDFTRYWVVADAIGSLAGYPVTGSTLPQQQGGMPPYFIDLPIFPMLLLASFRLFGHDSLAAQLPTLAANVALPLLLFRFYRRAGLGDAIAYAAACAVAVFPFLRLYTLNAPLPDALFEALLVAAATAFLEVVQDRGSTKGKWALFGLLGALASLTRPEGIPFAAVMFAALVRPASWSGLCYAAGCFLAIIAPFSLLMAATFGAPWPQNFGSSFGFGNLELTILRLEQYSLPHFAEGLGLSTSGLLLCLGIITALAVLGTLWMVVRQWRIAVLPAVAAAHIAFVFGIDPRASGAGLWFDFFRHISYGLPFLAVALVLPAHRLVERAWVRIRGANALEVEEARRAIPAVLLSLFLLLFSTYELRLLAYPAPSFGDNASQLLTTDDWVSLSDIVANRYPLPVLPVAPVNGKLAIDPGFDYMERHLDEVNAFFQPISSVATGRGSGHQLASILVMLFGAVFAACRSWSTAEASAFRAGHPH